MSADQSAVEVIAALARDGLLLDANACAFLLCVRDRAGNISRCGFCERVAVKGSFPRPVDIQDGGQALAPRGCGPLG